MKFWGMSSEVPDEEFQCWLLRGYYPDGVVDVPDEEFSSEVPDKAWCWWLQGYYPGGVVESPSRGSLNSGDSWKC